MSYQNQIRILESKLKQIESLPNTAENINKILTINADLKRMRRLEWEENYERLKLEDDR